MAPAERGMRTVSLPLGWPCRGIRTVSELDGEGERGMRTVSDIAQVWLVRLATRRMNAPGPAFNSGVFDQAFLAGAAGLAASFVKRSFFA